MTLIEYIKSSFDIAVTISSEKQFKALKKSLNYEINNNYSEDYESLLRKEECDIRQHISIQHQLKLYGEKLIDKLEELEKENLILSEKLVSFILIFQDYYKKLEEKNIIYISKIDNLKNELKNYEEKNHKLIQNEKNLKLYITQKDKEIKRLKIKLLNKPDLSHSSNNRSYSNFININNNSNNTSIRLSSGISHKEEKFTRINLVKKSTLPMERMKIQEKLQEYRKLIDKKMKDITRNKNSCKTYREKSSKSKECSLENNNKSNINNMSALNCVNYDISKKLNEISYKNVEKEEKTPIKKIPINNKTQSLVNFLKKNQNNINGKNENHSNEKYGGNVSKEFVTQESSKNNSNCNSKRNSLSQFIFSNFSNQKKKK